MPDLPPTTGARVRITTEGVIAEVRDSEIRLANGVNVEYSRDKDIRIEILEPGFQPDELCPTQLTVVVRVNGTRA